jgi:hypothetical protein
VAHQVPRLDFGQADNIGEWRRSTFLSWGEPVERLVHSMKIVIGPVLVQVPLELFDVANSDVVEQLQPYGFYSSFGLAVRVWNSGGGASSFYIEDAELPFELAEKRGAVIVYHNFGFAVFSGHCFSNGEDGPPRACLPVIISGEVDHLVSVQIDDEKYVEPGPLRGTDKKPPAFGVGKV